jgi:DNA polymerase V
VVGERIARELNGISCLALEEIPASKKGIASAKSFGRPVETLLELEEALSTYTARAGEKLRAGGLLATHLHVFVATNPFSARHPQYQAGAQRRLAPPTNHTPDLIAASLHLLRGLFRPGYFYKKTGVFVTDLIGELERPADFFEDTAVAARNRRIDGVVDGLNRKLGRNAIRYAAMGTNPKWTMRQEKRSKKFTTRWDELPEAKA